QPGPGMTEGVREMTSIHVPRLAGRRRGGARRGRIGPVALAVSALAALALVGGTPYAAYAAEGPFGGTAAAVPGTVQAANYDTGGQGVAYNVTSVNGTANGYRSDGVDLEATSDTQDTSPPGGADNLGWTAGGQWFKYTVNVASAGTYTVSLRLASPNGVTDGLHIAGSSGANLSGSVNVPATGGWQTWTTVTATVALPAGRQTLTIDQDNGGWNIYTMAYASSGSTPPPGTSAWAVGVAYTVGQLVTYQGHTYKCLQA